MTRELPPIKPRPKFAQWLWERDIILREAAGQLECSYEQVRVICLPFEDPSRRVPSEALIERIVEYTGGQITAADFYPARLLGVLAPVAEPAA